MTYPATKLHGQVHQHPGTDGIENCCVAPIEQVERVVWTDSGMHIDHGWATTDVYRSSATKWQGSVVTVGQVLYEDDDVLVIGLSHDKANDTWFGAQLIAKANITRRDQWT